MIFFHPEIKNFWDFSLNELLTLILAVVNIIFVIYVTIFQRNKDKRDRLLIINQIKYNTKLEWFKLLLIEPNIDKIYKFFQNVYDQLALYKSTSDKDSLSVNINSLFNDFENNFLSLLSTVSSDFETSNTEIIDELRDFIFNSVDSQTKIKIIEDQVFSSRNSLINSLYNFNPSIIN